MNVQELIDAINQTWEQRINEIRAEIEQEKIEGWASRNGALQLALAIIDKHKKEWNNADSN